MQRTQDEPLGAMHTNGSLPRPDELTGAAWWRAAALLAVGLVLAFGLLAVVWLLARPLALLLAAIVLAESLTPAICALEGRIGRIAAALLVYTGLLLGLGALGWIVATQAVVLGEEVLANTPVLLDRIERVAEGWNPTVGRGVRQSLESHVVNSSDLLVELPTEVAAGAVIALMVLAMAVYWSVSSHALGVYALWIVPPEHRAAVASVLREVVETMGGYVRARVLAALITAAALYVSLLLLGVDYPLILALLAALGALVPVIGPIIAVAPAAAVALLESPTVGVVVVGLYAVLMQVKAHILAPHLAHKHADIPPLLVIFALLAGGSVGGMIGAIVAPPLLGALRVIAVRVVAPALRRWLRSEVTAEAPPADGVDRGIGRHPAATDAAGKPRGSGEGR